MSLHSNTAKCRISGVAKCGAQRLFVTGVRRINVFMTKKAIELFYGTTLLGGTIRYFFLTRQPLNTSLKSAHFWSAELQSLTEEDRRK